jgi:hypothetical protein
MDDQERFNKMREARLFALTAYEAYEEHEFRDDTSELASRIRSLLRQHRHAFRRLAAAVGLEAAAKRMTFRRRGAQNDRFNAALEAHDALALELKTAMEEYRRVQASKEGHGHV